MSVERVEQRLSELRARTDAVRARPGFQARVMLSIADAAAGTFRAELSRAGRRFVPVALAVALLTVGWASRTGGIADAASSAEVVQAELYSGLSW
jgi:hypothetical protein